MWSFFPRDCTTWAARRWRLSFRKSVDRTPEGGYDAILLGYGLCGNGLDGLTARHTRLVLPRAHDCIALLMGSRERYQRYFDANPGTFYRSTGWLERGKGLQQLTHQTIGLEESLEALIGKYGDDNGRYLYGEMMRYRSRYEKLTFIETGLEADGKFIAGAAAEAKENKWNFERLPGDLAWLRNLVRGEWSEAEFAIAKPGQHIAVTYDERIVASQNGSSA